MQIPLPTALSKEELKRAVEAAFHRLTTGVLKTVVIVKPQPTGPDSQRYSELEKTLAELSTDLPAARMPDAEQLKRHYEDRRELPG